MKNTIEKHPIALIASVIIVVVTITFKVVSYIDNSKYETIINEYKSTIAKIERNLGGKDTIDISKLISITNQSNNNSNSVFFPKDNFFATRDKYWKYKYTSPIELFYIKNGKKPPSEIKDNPIDMPIHIWVGREKYIITGLELNISGEVQRKKNKIELPNHQMNFFCLDQQMFTTLIVLQRWDKNENSIISRSKENIDSVTFAIDFNEIPKAELMGRFLEFEMETFYKNYPKDFYYREILSVQKKDDILYSQFLTTYQKIEINNIYRDKFYLYTEFIVINSNNNLYTLRIEAPSTEPRKIGDTFMKITEWFTEFGIVNY